LGEIKRQLFSLVGYQKIGQVLASRLWASGLQTA
jgi:hypothetical protein